MVGAVLPIVPDRRSAPLPNKRHGQEAQQPTQQLPRGLAQGWDQAAGPRALAQLYWNMEKQFNDLKHEPEFGMEYATEVSKFVAQGACRDFRRAYENWRNPTLNAERPTFKKKNR